MWLCPLRVAPGVHGEGRGRERGRGRSRDRVAGIWAGVRAITTESPRHPAFGGGSGQNHLSKAEGAATGGAGRGGWAWPGLQSALSGSALHK